MIRSHRRRVLLRTETLLQRRSFVSHAAQPQCYAVSHDNDVTVVEHSTALNGISEDSQNT